MATMRDTEKADTSKKERRRKESEDTYRQGRIDEAKENLNIAMRLAQKGTKAGLSEDEEKAYREAVRCLNRRVNVFAGMADNGNASAEELALLQRLQSTRDTWEKHNGKSLKVNEKEDEEKPEPPRRYEPSPLDIPLFSEAIDEFAQVFGYGTYGDKRDRISYLFGAWLKNRAADAAKVAKRKIVNRLKESLEDSDQPDGSNPPHNDEQDGNPDAQFDTNLEDQRDDEPDDLYEGNDPEFTAFLFDLSKNALDASKGDREALDWLKNEGQELFNYWYKQEVWGDEQEWFEDPRLIDDLKASFEIIDLDEEGNPIYAEEDGYSSEASFVDDANQPDLMEWVEQQQFDEMEAYLAEHPLLRFARSAWLTGRSAGRYIKDFGSAVKKAIWRPGIEHSRSSDEEWARKVASIKTKQQVWVDPYTKSDGTRVKGHNKSVYKNVRR